MRMRLRRNIDFTSVLSTHEGTAVFVLDLDAQCKPRTVTLRTRNKRDQFTALRLGYPRTCSNWAPSVGIKTSAVAVAHQLLPPVVAPTETSSDGNGMTAGKPVTNGLVRCASEHDPAIRLVLPSVASWGRKRTKSAS